MFNLFRWIKSHVAFPIRFSAYVATKGEKRYEQQIYLRLSSFPKEAWTLSYNGCGGFRFTAKDTDGQMVAVERTYTCTRWLTGMPLYGAYLSRCDYATAGSPGWLMPGSFWVDWLYKELRRKFRQEIRRKGMREDFDHIGNPMIPIIAEKESLYQGRWMRIQ